VAHLLDASATAVNTSSGFANGVINTGGGSTTTSQTISPTGAVIATADSVVHNVSIVNLVKIDTIHTIVKAVYDGVHKPQATGSTTISGASVLGLPVAIDQGGIHIVGQTNKQVLDILNQQLTFLLQANYSTISVLGATTTPGDHKIQVQAGGLLFNFNDTVSGAPHAPPVAEIPHCDQIIKKVVPQPIQDKVLSQVPANLCAPPQPPDPNAEYTGVANIGSAGVLVGAQSFSYNIGGGGLGGGLLGGGGGPTSQFAAGTPAIPGSSGTPGLAGAPAGPQLAGPSQNGGTPAAYVEDLSGVAKKLKYLFPALLLAVIGILAGRIGRAPARLPRVSA
jgi:hypothetical protein